MNSEVQNTVVFHICLVICTNCFLLPARKNMTTLTADNRLVKHKHRLTLYTECDENDLSTSSGFCCCELTAVIHSQVLPSG